MSASCESSVLQTDIPKLPKVSGRRSDFGKMFEQWKGRSPCAVEGWQSLQETFLLKEGMMEMLIAFSCGLDASDLACFLLYPERTQFDCFRVIDCSN